jgi:excisionase family DNA binding protein
VDWAPNGVPGGEEAAIGSGYDASWQARHCELKVHHSRLFDNNRQQLLKLCLTAGAVHRALAPHQDQQMAKKPDNVLTIVDLSAYLKISTSTLYKLAQEGRLPGQKVGRHWRFHREAVDDWLKARTKANG